MSPITSTATKSNNTLSICSHGFNHCRKGENHPANYQVQLCKQWILENCWKSKIIDYRHSSYLYKHLVEGDYKEYIANGAFIKAAIELGYEYKRDGLNAHFNLRIHPEYYEAQRARGVYII